ncbi:MAG: 3'-5' exonuclease [Chloroherpetonaceae bacterium]|nr:3'-5' exonuclease [Chloroherpetonaceae bacterium]
MLPSVEKFLSNLNEPQAKAVSSTNGPVMIIAGAGSGKTRVITFRTAYIIQYLHTPPGNILSLTFTNKAAREMKDRIDSVLGQGASRGLWIGTFHSNFAKLLRQHASLLNFTNSFSIYDSEDSQRVIKEIMNDLGINPQLLTPNTVQSMISRAKNRFVLPHQMLESKGSVGSDYATEKAAMVYQRYAEKLRSNNAMDFDDLLIKPIELFMQEPRILEFYQERFEYLMIDEYQDTNYAQYLVAKLLSQKHRNICVVGDDAQSIYSWRGADITNILSFQNDYTDSTVVRLEENYRSTKTILAIANSVIKQNRGQLEKNLFTRNDSGERVTFIEAFDEKNEASKIINAIRDQKLLKGYSNKDFAIFYRTNSQSRVLEDALRQNGISYQVFGNVSFYKRKEIKDVVAYLRLLNNPADEESLLRIINYPTRGIGDTSLDKLRQLAYDEGISLFDLIRRASMYDIQPRLASALRDFYKLIQSLQKTAEKYDAFEVVRELYEETRILEILKNDNTTDSSTRFDNLQEFLSLAKSYCEKHAEQNKLPDFLQDVALLTDAQDDDEDASNKVALMTVHSAKGLEFPIVFVTGLEEKLFPLNPETNEELEEERRLFYVALTRARKKLYLSYAKNRFRFGFTQPSLKSRFLDEIDGDVVETEGGKLLSDLRIEKRENTRITRDYSDGEEYRGGGTWNRKPKKEMDYDDYVASGKMASRQTKPKAEIEGPALAIGMKVSHKIFGVGKITSLEGNGDGAKAKIFFRSAGEKTLVVKFANLTIVEPN